MFDWERIDTVLLDMDGTLLDLHFDNHFWLEYVPGRYAELHGMTPEAAKEELMKRYRRVEGTLDWYCVDYWSRELGLDIPLLKAEVDHLIGVHPHVLDFLEILKKAGKARVLVTNAHQKALQLKMAKTRLGGYLDQVVSAHELGLPKENPAFWERLHQRVNFDPGRTLFIDDSIHRQPDNKRRALTLFTINTHLAFMLVDDYRIRDCQTLARAFAYAFRSKEWFEDTFAHLIRHATTAV